MPPAAMPWRSRNRWSWPSNLLDAFTPPLPRRLATIVSLYRNARQSETRTMHRPGPSCTRFLLRPRTRYALAWVLAVTSAGVALCIAWNLFAAPKRKDGNSGHTNIDFGGQWLMGRMLAKGLGRHLYHREVQRAVLREAYPRADEVPPDQRKPEERERHDAEDLVSWLVGRDDPEVAASLAGFLTPLAADQVIGAVTVIAAGQQCWTAERVDRAA